MDLTSYLLGKKSGGAPSYTVKSGTTSVAGYQKIMEQIEELTVDDTSCACLFYNCKASSLPKLKGTEKVTNLSNMFYNCSNVLKIDLSKNTFGTITNVSSTFNACNKVCVVDISTLDLTNVSSYSNVFSSCGNNSTAKNGAYANGIPYVYVKNTAMQNWVLNTSGCPSTWSTSNVLVKQ